MHNDFKKFLAEKSPSNVLEVGCGSGYYPRNLKELFNLQCWALTCESYFSTEEWLWLYKSFNYNGDYEFIFFE